MPKNIRKGIAIVLLIIWLGDCIKIKEIVLKMQKKQKVLTIILSIIAAAILVVCIIVGGKSFSANYDGKIIVEVVDIDGEVIKDKKIKFSEGDTLVGLLTDNFDNVLVTGEGEWQMIQKIETIENAADWSTYISIYVDDVESPVGIASIEFADGMKISLKLIENPYA